MVDVYYNTTKSCCFQLKLIKKKNYSRALTSLTSGK